MMLYCIIKSLIMMTSWLYSVTQTNQAYRLIGGQMLFNPTKCYKMSVYQSRSAVLKDYTLCNQTLVAVQPHPCLGTLLSSDLRWNPHMDKIAKKGNSTLAFVKRKLYACSEESITCQATSRVCHCSMGSLQTESCGETVSSLKSCSQIY